VPDQAKLEVAQLIEVTLGDSEQDAQPVSDGRTLAVQFNPESLRLVYANSVDKPAATGSSAMQYIASSSTKLDVELVFDVSVDPDQSDVRKATENVHYFITPKKAEDPTKFVVPGVRFQWGSFLFDGVVTTLSETLELFSQDGRPLRSKISLSFASQDIKFRIRGIAEASAGAGPGQQPHLPVKQGDSVQQLASQGGRPGGWKALASANGIENPRLPQVGSLLSVKVR